MIEESATVVAVEPGFVWVETQRQSACGSCAAKAGCGTSVLAKVYGQRRARVRAVAPEGMQVGDTVVIGLREDAFVKGSLAVYLVPLAGLLAGGLLGELLGQRMLWSGEAATLLAGLAGFLAGLAWVRRFAHRVQADTRFQPVVLRRLATESPVAGIGPVASGG